MDELNIDKSKVLTNINESISESLITKGEFQFSDNTLYKKFEWTIDKNGELVRGKGTSC